MYAPEPLGRQHLLIANGQIARKGRITAGADADLVVLTSTGDLSDVMAMGRWHIQDGRAAMRGAFEQVLA